MAMLSRHAAGKKVPDVHAASFMFSGKSSRDEEEVVRRTAGGRDADGLPYPISQSLYGRCSPTKCGLGSR